MSKPSIAHHDLDSIQSLIKRQRSGLLALLYANSRPRVGTYLPLAQAIIEAGHSAVVLFNPTRIDGESDDLAGFENFDLGIIDPFVIPQIEGVDVIFSSEAVPIATKKSYSVRIVHSLPDKKFSINYASRIRRRPHIATTADYLAIAVRQPISNWTIENYTSLLDESPPNLEGMQRDRLDIVPAGYPKIEYLAANIPQDGEKKYLMYCPTSTKVSHSLVESHGVEIIRTLLERFPAFEVVFRPYPSADVDKLATIKSKFSCNARFQFDDTLTGISFLKKTAIIVTDNSSVAVSFSLATGRPSIFFDNLDPTPLATEDLLGYRTSSIPQIIESIAHGLENSSAWHSKILRERTNHLYHAGSASAYLASKLPVFASGGTDPEWLSVSRELLFLQGARPE